MNYTLHTKSSDPFSLSDFRDWVIGYDKVFQKMLTLPTASTHSNYPPHNLIEDGEGQYTISMAVAGLDKDDIKITLAEQNLTIEYDGKSSGEQDKTILHQGIAHRSFKKIFHLAENIEVKDASMDKGLIIIKLEQNIPEEKKPKTIELK
jgi:molecular chaperone IbpA